MPAGVTRGLWLVSRGPPVLCNNDCCCVEGGVVRCDCDFGEDDT